MPWPGWLDQFNSLCKMRFGRRMRLAAVCMMVIAAMGIAVGLLFIFGASTGVRNLVLALTLAAAPVPLYVAMTLWLDRFEAEPMWMLGVCFVWGATAAALIAMVVNHEAMLYLGHWQQHWQQSTDSQMSPRLLSTLLAAPAVEELAKGFILLLLFMWNHDEFDGVLDGIIYAAMAGLGFAMTENIVYYAQAMAQLGPWGLTTTAMLRGLIFPFQHPFFTSFLGIGLGWAAVTQYKTVRLWAPPIGLALSISLHVLWNLSTIHRHYFIAGYLLVSVPVMLGVITLVMISLRGEAILIAQRLHGDLVTGALTHTEHRRLSRISRRIYFDAQCLLKKGVRAWWASICFHQSASELAFFREHVSTGRLQADLAREKQYLDRLEELRPKFAKLTYEI